MTILVPGAGLTIGENESILKDAKLGRLYFTLGEEKGGFSLGENGVEFIEPFKPNTESVVQLFELMTNIIRTGIPLKLKCCKRDGDDIILDSGINNYKLSITDLRHVLLENEICDLLDV